eukprot:m.102302 g.102302  ORF g.102302 m.102302 type:complete len:127 (+) comp37163_c0_seq1:1892-2272(+)
MGVLPFRWCAPEVLTYKVFSELSDIWSFGILMWEIATCGGTPYPGVPVDRLFDLLMTQSYRMSRPRGCPKPLHQLMTDCWSDLPRKRPRFADVVCRLDACCKDMSSENSSQNVDIGRKPPLGFVSA